MIDTISDMVRKRAFPGLLIFGSDYRLLYINDEARRILFGTRGAQGDLAQVPEEIARLGDCLKSRSAGVGSGDRGGGCQAVDAHSGISMRASYLGAVPDGGGAQLIMVLLERVSDRREVDLELAQRQFQLTRKEVEVLRHICSGLPNRKIAERMFISEYTVKNHIKKIMRRMRVNSRCEMVAAVR